MITNSASQFIFDCMKRGDYLPFAERNMREEFSSVPLRQICAWCPTFDPHDPANKGASHTICPAYLARMNAEMDK